MADRSTGPVKPPVIDLTARAGARAESETRTSAETARTEASARPLLDLSGANWPVLGGVAVAGAVLGTILTYLLSTLLPLPSHQQIPPDLSGFVNAQGAQLKTLSDSVGAQGEQITTLTDQMGQIQDQAKKTQIGLDATVAQLDGDMSAVNKSIDDLKASMPATQAPVDLAPLETELKTLKAQVDAIAAGASGADASAIAQSLSAVQGSLDSLTTRLNGVDQTVAALRTDLDAARKTLTDHINSALPNEVGPAMKLPLILSGLESALDTGKPFQDELTALASVLPDLTIPDVLKSAAATGLARPDALSQKFEATLPEILSARSTTSGDWTQNAVDWAKSLLALRPASEEDGTSPEAIVSRIEGAMSRRDYATATSLLAQLPAPMQQAAAPVANDIAAHAAADQLIVDLRARALRATGTKP